MSVCVRVFKCGVVEPRPEKQESESWRKHCRKKERKSPLTLSHGGGLDVVKVHEDGAAGHNARATGQKVTPNNALQHTALATALGTHCNNGREADGGLRVEERAQKRGPLGVV